MESALRFTMVSLGTFGRDQADRLRDTLRAAFVNSFIQPKIGVAPAGGCFEVFLTTSYVFSDEDGNELEGHANKVRVTEHVLAVLAAELVN